MELGALIEYLLELAQEHGNHIRVMGEHADITPPEYIRADYGCPAYININQEH